MRLGLEGRASGAVGIAPGRGRGQKGAERGLAEWEAEPGRRAGPLTTRSSPPCPSPTCPAMWRPLVLLLLLLPVVPIPSATAVPIPDARSQDSLQSLLQGSNRLSLGFGARKKTEKRGGADSKRSQRDTEKGRDRDKGREPEGIRYNTADEGLA